MPDIGYIVRLPQAPHLDTELERLAALGRNDAVKAIKDLRQAEFAAMAQQQVDHLGEMTGHDVAVRITALVDALVRSLVERACAKAGAPADWAEQVGVFALGGYGRGEMAPYSDLDLLVLGVGSQRPEWLDKMWTELQTLLWDARFQVGASLRSQTELQDILDEDFVTGTAIAEQRVLVGGPEARAAMADLLRRFRSRRATAFLRYKVDELSKRRSQAGASVFLMEPNLKTNPGCMRDVQLLRNIAFAVFGSRNLLSLADLDVVTRKDLQDVLATNDHLLSTRALLHFHHQRKQDVFQLADQVRTAKLHGYADVSRLRAVEHFMKRHYAQVLHVHQMVDLVLSRVEAQGHLGTKPSLVRSRRALTPEFAAVAGRVYVTDAGFWRLPDAGVKVFAMCRAAQKAGVRLSLELQRTIRTHVHIISESVRRDPAIGRLFLQILGDTGMVHPILKDMHACGVLGAYLPEFGNLTCLMQFDSYHQYTADEHTLIAISNLDAVARGDVAGLPGMRRIFAGVERKDLLALSLLLHDMGKYMGRGHVARGAIMVETVARRLGLDRDEEDLVYFLIERHVSLSDASRMRNFQEPQFLKEFAARMGEQPRLDALYCLTWCDAKAVGEGILTGWQEAILGELYAAVSRTIAGGTGVFRSRHFQLVDAMAGAGIPADEAAALLDRLGGTYDHQVQPAEAVKHAIALRELELDGIGLGQELGEKFCTVSLALPDRHGLLADVAATLSGHGFDIIDARTWVTDADARGTRVVLYSLRLSCIYPAKMGEAETWIRLRRDLRAVAHGQLDPRTLLARRKAAMVGNRPADSGFDDPAVKVEQRTSPEFTIVDIHTKDEVGLLSRLCRAISEQGCDIGYACINTMGDVAVDVFYVNRAGTKLTDVEADSLRTHLVTSLGLDPRVRT